MRRRDRERVFGTKRQRYKQSGRGRVGRKIDKLSGRGRERERKIEKEGERVRACVRVCVYV